MKLTLEQRENLLTWAAEGVKLWGVNERALRFDPPFQVEYLQLKHARKRAATQTLKLRETIDEAAIIGGLALKEARIRSKIHRADLLRQVIAERAKADEMQVAPGGRTGLLAIDYKGKDADQPVYKVDAGLLKELRELEKEIAIELGQWTEKSEITGLIEAAIVRMPVKAASREEWEQAQKAQSGE